MTLFLSGIVIIWNDVVHNCLRRNKILFALCTFVAINVLMSVEKMKFGYLKKIGNVSYTVYLLTNYGFYYLYYVLNCLEIVTRDLLGHLKLPIYLFYFFFFSTQNKKNVYISLYVYIIKCT